MWVAEGFTDYYGALLVARAGLSTPVEYLDELSNTIEQVQMRPGRLVQPVDMASFDTWIKHYRPDENSLNTSIDYYSKGASIAFMLDAKIRKTTGGARTLDDAMRLAYARYSGAKGCTLEQFYAVMSEAAGANLTPWFTEVVSRVEELDFSDALDYYGLRFTPADPKAARATLGASTRVDNGRLVVTVVRRDTPAHAAGLNTDDEILAIDDVRVRADALVTRMDQYRVGDTVRVLVARRDRLVTLAWWLSPAQSSLPSARLRSTILG